MNQIKLISLKQNGQMQMFSKITQMQITNQDNRPIYFITNSSPSRLYLYKRSLTFTILLEQHSSTNTPQFKRIRRRPVYYFALLVLLLPLCRTAALVLKERYGSEETRRRRRRRRRWWCSAGRHPAVSRRAACSHM